MSPLPIDVSDAAVLEKQTPRSAKTAPHQTQINIQNRRREYLTRHPSYLTKVDHELADPILYERLIKRHQSFAERESEGKAKGYGRTLEADLIRGETKVSNISPVTKKMNPDKSSGEETWDQEAQSKEHGLLMWHEFLTDRFVKGGDDEFEYSQVDDRDDLDVLAQAEEEEQWYDQEEPSWHEDTERKGETGVQDF